MNFDKELAKIGLTREQYGKCLQDICDKLNGLKDIEWAEIKSKYNLPWSVDVLRKSSGTLFGGFGVSEYLKDKKEIIPNELILENIRKEKIKLQTLNTERNRLDRAEARQTLYFEQVSNVITSLPLPDFEPLRVPDTNNISYLLTLADMHYGAKFISQNNAYSREICKERLEFLVGKIKNFVVKHEINTLYLASLGDCIQGVLRLSDLKLNDTSVVKCVVEISQLIASFINELSTFVRIEYYHCGFSNHTQIRFLGAKANELGDEDLEYIIGHYIKDLLVNNKRVTVHLIEDNHKYIKINIPYNEIIAMHGHGIKNYENALKDITNWMGEKVDYLILGHLHSGQIIPNNECSTIDTEILVCPSFCGSDPYADSLFKGNKAAVEIYGFDYVYGHTETHKIILN